MLNDFGKLTFACGQVKKLVVGTGPCSFMITAIRLNPAYDFANFAALAYPFTLADFWIFASSAARRIAAFMLDSSATPFPAISIAVP